MTLTAIGGITITPISPAGPSVQMTTDPVVQQTWEPRKTIEAGLEGAETTQDWGMFAIDCRRTLTWGGRGQWLEKSVVLQLQRWLATTGSTYNYVDSEGNDWTVEFILPFKADREFGYPSLYTCTMTIHVLSM